MFLFAAPTHAKLTPTLEIQSAEWVPYLQLPERLGQPHIEWFARDRAWLSGVFDRVREAVQRD